MKTDGLPRPPARSIWKTNLPGAILLVFDVAGFSAAWSAAWHLRRWLNPWMDLPINEFEPYTRVAPVMVAVGLVNCALFGLYRVRGRLAALTRWDQLLKAGYHYLLYLMVVGYFLKELDLGRSVIFLAAALAFAYLYASRSVLRALKANAFARGRGLVRAAIVGTGKLAREVKESLHHHPEVGFELAGFIRHPNDPENEAASNGLAIIGEADQIDDLVREHGIEELFIAVPHLTPTEQLNLISLGRTRGLKIQLVSNLFGVITARAKVDEIAAFPVIPLRDGHLSWSQGVVKRAFDLAVATVGALVWILFFHWWIALWIRLDSPGPVIFRQTRIGRDGQPFEFLKYRTMHVEAKQYDIAPTSPDDPRITRAGRWLRKTSLDELPQLVNVLRGEMSMVGPRPEMPFIVERYEEWEKRRLDVKPGITGLWQVIGRKNLPLHLNMEYDFYYILNQSLLLDIEILIRTVPAVLKGKGAF
jgi:exopolysaccharide biosynthesis polyprenyl glycosylphosphotransferase